MGACHFRDTALNTLCVRGVPILRAPQSGIILKLNTAEDIVPELTRDFGSHAELRPVEVPIVRCCPSGAELRGVCTNVNNQSGSECANIIREQSIVAAGEKATLVAGPRDPVV